ncbi:MAG: hypothetical protein BCS36_09965 [Desulfovibrio sp. MES5]|uniref:DUF4019 domain-containing protein n=1 Tax=Desulfovibrio sp. MES5 TaxID=1899016 RepID=UPI000B9C82F8|nr:DUF4019 domain-containing protein [Desulfovibrio sp. MES5]OXS28477.1 MAG: hypothetical protein BCS36_09965 [Desulfovibrio sp. MES5]
MRKFVLCSLIAFAICVSTSTAFGASAPDKAMEAASVWLALADKGDVQATWNQAAEAFKTGIELKEWEKKLPKARQPFGDVITRKASSSETTTTLPGVPDGEYAIFRFQTAFAHKKNAVETLLMQKEKDGGWRTIGYFIK